MSAHQPTQRWLPCEEDATGHSFGEEELANLARVMSSGVLLASRSGFVGELEAEFAGRNGVAHAIAVSSCTTGLQAALAIRNFAPGSEVITTPLTDIGGVSAILQAGLVPVFADVDPVTGNIDPDSVRRAIGPRTVALIVTHLVGRPCALDLLMSAARDHDLYVVEDCAQAFDARFDDRPVGTFGHVGVFSTQQTKHISSGEGGLLLTNDDNRALALRTWINKGVAGGVRARDEDHPVLGANARMTELQAAVLLPQLTRLTETVARRIAAAESLSAELNAIDGVSGPDTDPRSTQTYWKYLLTVESQNSALCERIATALDEREAIVGPRYLHLPLFAKSLFTRYPRRLVGRAAATFHEPGGSDDLDLFPGVRAFMDRSIVLWWNENVSAHHVERIAELIRRVAADPH